MLRNPEAYGERVSRPFYRYLCLHKLFRFVQQSFRSAFSLGRNAPLPKAAFKPPSRSFGTVLEPRYIFGAGPLDQ